MDGLEERERGKHGGMFPGISLVAMTTAVSA
jgi:hypothetical protein